MENEMNIPEEVIDLLQSKSFDQLSDTERILTLKHISEAAYAELYLASQNGFSYFKEDIEPSIKVRQNLSKAFAKKHLQPKSVFQYRIEVWKIAAVFVPLLFIMLWAMSNKMTAQQLATIVVRDTIMVQQKIKQVEYVIDTVVAYKYINIERDTKASVAHFTASNHREDTNIHQLQQKLNIGIRTLQAEDLMQEMPNKNGKSMQEDELLKHFTFAGI
jgi:hypothetical protein